MGQNVTVLGGGKFYGAIKTFKKAVEKEWGIDFTDMIQVGVDEGNPVLLPLAHCIVEIHQNAPHANAINCDTPLSA